MNEITTINDLYEALCLKGKTEAEDIEGQFGMIADALLNRFAIKKGNLEYRIVEIEFYHNKTDEQGKKITYKRDVTDACDFFFHASGVDLCFRSNEDSYGGILIRSIECTGKFINGPGRVVDRLFDKFSAIRIPDDFPQLVRVSCKDGKHIVPVISRRWIKTSTKEYRYSWPKSEWEPDPKKYPASPWAEGNR